MRLAGVRPMSEAEKAYWPGQVLRLTFDRDQLKALSSSSRATIFWTYVAEYPRSVKEVGELTGFKPQAVRYHTNHLLEVGLIIPVETRKSYARTEEAYVTKGVYSITPSPPVSKEILRIKRKAFQAAWHQFERDRAAVNQLENVDPSQGFRSNMRRSVVRLKREDLEKFRKAADQLIDDFFELESPDGTLVTLAALFCPVFGESAKEYEQITGKKLRISERHEDEDEE